MRRPQRRGGHDRHLTHFEALVEMGMDLSRELALEVTLQRVVELVTRLASARYGALGVLDDAGRIAQFFTAGIDEATKTAIAHPPESKGILGLILQEQKVLRLRDLTQDPRAWGFPPHHPPMKSFLGIPIVAQGQALGGLYLAEKQGAEEFSEEDEALVMTFASQAALAIQNAHLYAEVGRHAEELEREVEKRTRELEATNAWLEEALRRAEEASHHKSAFLANVSHELRTPLNAIIGFAEVLQDGLAGSVNDKQHHYLENIRQSGYHLLNLINDILDLSKVEVGRVELRPETFGLKDALKAAISAIRSQAVAKGLTVELHVDEAISTLTADPIRFKQILYNLLSNAVKFTPPGGNVCVSARVQRPTSNVQSYKEADVGHRTLDTAGFVEISVSDTGIGIKAEDLPKLFQPFTQLEVSVARRYEGTGLGLALTKRLVELHGGEIHAESAGEGKGSTFTVTLPLRPPGREQPRLFLVDDDMGFVELLAIVLRQAGYQVEIATNGPEALAMLETRPPDLLLLDLKLPGCDGRDILARLRSRQATRWLLVVVFTGVEGISGAEIRKLGAQEFLTKPFSTTVLLQVIARLLGPERRAFPTPPV